MHKSNITLLVLCGGRGQRAGGNDKPLLVYKGQPILTYILASLGPIVERVLISANRNLDIYRAYGYPVQVDENPFEGPLAALASCKPCISTSWVLVCPGDNPLVKPTILQALLSDLDSTGSKPDILLVHDGERAQPLYFLSRTDCLPTMEYALGEQRAIMRWIDTLNVRLVKVNDKFVNINTEEELRKLEQLRDKL